MNRAFWAVYIKMNSSESWYSLDREIWEIVHPFWRQFPRVPHSWHILAGTALTVVTLIGIVGNLAVLMLYWR